jgi:hypothetical protein
MSELEDIGRYHQQMDVLKATLAERNDRLRRASIILSAASEPPYSSKNAARRCNFSAAQRLMDEAKDRHEAAELMIEDLRQLAAAAGKSAPALE